MTPFMLHALLAAIGIALLAGPLGCLMVWKRVSYLGDTLAHGSVLGLAVGFLMGADPVTSLILLSFLWAFLLWYLSKDGKMTTDTILTLLMQSSLALSILLFAFIPNGETNLMHIFVGDILMVNQTDLILLYGANIVALVLIWMFWKKWVLMSINEDLAVAAGVKTGGLQILFFCLVGLFIALGIKIVGALLAPALLIIPAIAARPLSRTPEQMAVLGSVIALASCLTGLFLSFTWDAPTGPTMVLASLVFFLLTHLFNRILRHGS